MHKSLFTSFKYFFFILVNIRRSASVLRCVDTDTSDGKEPDFGCGARQFAEPGALFAFTSMLKPLPSLKLTWHVKMDGWNTSFLLGWPIFRCYVSFREGNHRVYFLLLTTLINVNVGRCFNSHHRVPSPSISNKSSCIQCPSMFNNFSILLMQEIPHQSIW